jgi:hypothetical protein
MFNALKYTEILEEAGFNREQSETTMNVMIEVMHENLATKQDLKGFELASKQDLKSFQLASKQDLKDLEVTTKHDQKSFEEKIELRFISIEHKIETLENRLVIKLGSLMVVLLSLFLAAFKFF